MSKTIAAVATGNCASGIGVIRISGEDAIKIGDRVFKAMDHAPLSSLNGYTAKYGRVFSGDESFDNAVALVFRAPKSYTGEDVVELSVHGGIFLVEKTLEAVLSAGAVPAEAGEFTKRAFLNGKIDLAQAEGVAALISAEGSEAARASYNLLQGALSKEIGKVLNNLLDCSASMAAWVDYPDEEIPELTDENLKETLIEAKTALKSLLDHYENGIIMTQGVDTVIAGRTNAGKSTLMNMLSGREKSIVTHIEGTTRDIVEDSVRLGGIVLHLSDTAGLRESDDLVEQIGIKKALDKVETAALVLAVFDGSAVLSEDDMVLIEVCKNKRCVALVNKTDLESRIDIDVIRENFSEVVFLSAKNGEGASELEQAVTRILGVDGFDSSRPLLANRRQKQCVLNAHNYISEALNSTMEGMTFDAINVLIDSAVDELLSLTGRKATEEVVNNIFSRFCVGK